MQALLAEFWLWYEENKADLGHYSRNDIGMYACQYAIVRRDGSANIRLWLEKTKRQLQFCKNPLKEQWKGLASHYRGEDMAA